MAASGFRIYMYGYIFIHMDSINEILVVVRGAKGDHAFCRMITLGAAMKKRTVVIGVVGSRLDAGSRENRWKRWRPTVSICQHDDLLVSRLELLHAPSDADLVSQVAKDIGVVSPETTVHTHELPLQNAWEFDETFTNLYEFAYNFPFRPDEEEYLLHITTGTHVIQICLFLLAESRHFPARLLQTSPERQQVRGTYQIIDLDLSRYDTIARRFAVERTTGQEFLKAGIATRNEPFNRTMELLERVACSSRAPILVAGPTGAGKTQLARRIYELKHHRRLVDGEFVEVNCATLRGDQTMSALFGHIEGAFTGASQSRMGLLRRADRGLLFLDEIGELGLDEQAMLLRAIEEKRFLPIGSDQEVQSDFQLIVGSNRNLYQRVKEGKFRNDLLARLNLWEFTLPGLADRPEDIEPNLDFELERHASTTGQRVTLNKEGRDRFLRFASAPESLWAGSFRDLSAAVTRMATLADGGRITEADVREEEARLATSWQTFPANDNSAAPLYETTTSTVDLNAIDNVLGMHLSQEAIASLDLFDRAQLREVVRVCRAARTLSDAGRQLFSETRKAKSRPNDADRLRKYLAKFGLTWTDFC
jgi:transcriptional regulatory protein RtcR